MDITFELLQNHHFSLLLKWLETPHVKEFWDQDIQWTLESIEEKYGCYINRYKPEHDKLKPLHAYIVKIDRIPRGYIQYYNAHDFPRDEPLDDLPQNLAAFDIYIGEPNYVGKGIGSKVLVLFLENYIFQEFENCLADPETNNIRAICAYEKAGFYEKKRVGNTLIMLRSKIKL